MVRGAVDWRGQAYTVGTSVLYPRASGRSVEMQEGEVLEIKYKTKNRTFREPAGWPGVMKNSYYSIDVEDMSVKIQPTRSSRFSRYSWQKDVPSPVWIQNTENITVVPS